jgi:hypothetical protein
MGDTNRYFQENIGKFIEFSHKKHEYTLWLLALNIVNKVFHVLYISVSQPPGRSPVPGPGINYTGPREINIL